MKVPTTHAEPRRWLLLALISLPLLTWAFLNYVQPRPFYVAEDDPEHETYYNAWLLHSGKDVLDVHRPGIPEDQMAAAAMAMTGGDLDRVQGLFIACRFLAALLTGLSLYVVARFSFRHVPAGVVVLALAPILGWPSFWIFADYFDPICLQGPLGLLTIAIVWSMLHDNAVGRWRPLLCGLALGLCLATKLTFVPLALAAVVAVAVQAWRQGGPITRRCHPVLLLIFATAASLCLFMAPATGKLPDLLWSLPQRQEISLGRGWEGTDLLSGWRVLFATSWPAAALIVGVVALFVVEITLSVTRYRRDSGGDVAATRVFLSLLLFGVFYTMACVASGWGGNLRNAYPSVLCVPFLAVHAFMAWRERRPQLAPMPARLQVVLVLIAAVVIVVPAEARVVERQAFIRSRQDLIGPTRARLIALKRPGTRVAVWDGSPASLLGEASFHFWGNHKYAADAFDPILLQRYPDFAFLRLREVGNLVRATGSGTGSVALADAVRQPGSALGWPGRLWRRIFPRVQEPVRTNELVAGESSGIRISLIAAPAVEVRDELEAVGLGEADFLSLARIRFGATVMRREMIAGVEWLLITVPER